ncbi:Dabb family protein [Microbacterium limosum]|uniref:Dabb family protein n=1 Tax=Microbacterium limosum TaxID=3079935 RepID=A0AAU0MI13_9MICO|nr:Dabb family protein [Microbacterium sp. Y20]WOQ70087.1 Dabb family protein [Microbacterium sp. Y20]
MSLRHIVMLTLSAQDEQQRAADAAEIKTQLEALVGLVPSLRAMSVGVNSLYPEENWDVVLIADFDDAEGLAAYVTHPAHVAAAEVIARVRRDRAAVDFEV